MQNLLAYFAVHSVRLLRDEIQKLQEAGAHVGEVVKVMSKTQVLVKVCACVVFSMHLCCSFLVLTWYTHRLTQRASTS